MEEGLRGAKNQPSREEGKVPSENGRLERAQRLLVLRINERVCTAERNLKRDDRQHFGVKAAAAAAQKTFSNFIRERERERENVGGGGEENDINEH